MTKSGIAPTENAIHEAKALKSKDHENGEIRSYIIFKTEGEKVEVETVHKVAYDPDYERSAKQAQEFEEKVWQSFYADLSKCETPRYALVDVKYLVGEGSISRPTDKLVFIRWNPDTAPTIAKFKIASSEGTVKAALDVVTSTIQVSDADGLNYKDILREL